MKVAVRERKGFKAVCTTEAVGAGEVVLHLEDGVVQATPTRTSIRIGVDRHVEHPIGRYVNHACDPTCRVEGLTLTAVRDLAAGTEVTFDYSTNEGPLASPFVCLHCKKILTGAPAPCQRDDRTTLEVQAAMCIARVRELWPELMTVKEIEDRALQLLQLLHLSPESFLETRTELERLLSEKSSP